MGKFLQEHWLGIMLAFGIATIAYIMGKAIPVIGGPVLGISLGFLTVDVELAALVALGVVFLLGARFLLRMIICPLRLGAFLQLTSSI